MTNDIRLYLDDECKNGFLQFVRLYRYRFCPSVGECIHRVTSEHRRKRHSLTQCIPPHFEHVLGFRDQRNQPHLVAMPYYRDTVELETIKRDCREFAKKWQIEVRFSVKESFWGKGTVLVDFTRVYFLKRKRKTGRKNNARSNRAIDA